MVALWVKTACFLRYPLNLEYNILKTSKLKLVRITLLFLIFSLFALLYNTFNDCFDHQLVTYVTILDSLEPL